jgi:hypothetical protein
MTKTEYNPKTGEIGFEWNCSNGSLFELNTNESRSFIDGVLNRDTQYLDITADPIEVRARPTFSATPDKTEISADGVEVMTISGLPKGVTKITIFGPVALSYEETRQKATISTNVAGAYRVRCSQWPYIDAEVTFNAR